MDLSSPPLRHASATRGCSACLQPRQRLPIVVAGLGQHFERFNWWLGYAKKFPSPVRATQLIHELAPNASVVWWIAPIRCLSTDWWGPRPGSWAKSGVRNRRVCSSARSAGRGLAAMSMRTTTTSSTYAVSRTHARATQMRAPIFRRAVACSPFCESTMRRGRASSAPACQMQRATHDHATLQHIVINRSKPQFAGLRLMLDSSSSFFLRAFGASGALPRASERRRRRCWW